MQGSEPEEIARERPQQRQASIAATARRTTASARLGRRSAVSSDALNERLTKIRLTIASTSEKNASARTSVSGIPRR